MEILKNLIGLIVLCIMCVIIGVIIGMLICNKSEKKESKEFEFQKIVEECLPDYEKITKAWIELIRKDNSKPTEIESINSNWGIIDVESRSYYKNIEEMRKNHDKYIDSLVDIEFNDPNNHYPKWLIKLTLQQEYDRNRNER